MKKELGRAIKLFVATALCGGVLAGCGNSENFVFTNTVNPVTPPVVLLPVANNDTVTALGNATLQQASINGVLSNDTLNGGEIIAFDNTSTNGAAIVLNADGSFTYTPTFGFTGPDTFTYTLGNTAGESTATVTVNVNALGFFVDNSQAANGNGSQANPFNNLADAILAASNGDTVFVYQGDGTTSNQSGAIVLPPGVNLIGQAQGLVLGQTIEPAGNRPVITGPITLGGDNTVAGFEINGAATDAITGGDISNISINNNVFANLSGENIDLFNIGGTLSVTNNTFDDVADGQTAIDIEQNNTNATFTFSDNIFNDGNTVDPDNGIDLLFFGSSMVTLNITGNEFTGDNIVSSFGYPVNVRAQDTADVTATITGNTMTDATNNAVIYVESTSTMGINAVISNNTIDGSNDDGIDYSWLTNVADTFVVRIENNNITNVDSKCIDLDGDTTGSSTGIVFIRDNVLTNAGDDNLRFNINGAANACLDLFGNTFDDSNEISDQGSSGTFDVERVDPGDGGPLDDPSVNNFTVGASLNTSGLVSQPAGFCQAQIP